MSFGKSIIVFLICAMGLLTACSEETPVYDPTNIVGLVQGEIQGVETPNGAIMWQGVPYGVISERWTVAMIAENWQGVRAPYAAPDCVSLGNPFKQDRPSVAEGSEDCLYLDISAPKDAVGSNLPVMVWIHGGGNSYGGPGDITLNRLVPDHDVILVALRYRTGPFGFLSSQALRDTGESVANFGISDQISALKWIKENIASFGGDAGRVTIFGESAGGRNVFGLLLSEQAKGLFHRAIIESGASVTTSQEEAENYTEEIQPGDHNSSKEVLIRMLIAASIASDRDDAKEWIANTPSTEQAAFMRDLSADEILNAYKDTPEALNIALPNVIRDGITIPDTDPLILLAEANYNHVPTIMGTNRDEVRLYQIFDPTFVDVDFIGRPVAKNMALYQRAAYYGSQAWKIRGVDLPISLMRENHEATLYAYRFDWDEQADPMWVDLPNLLGASHAQEISFVLGQFEKRDFPTNHYRDEDSERLKLSAGMMSYWAAFARDGMPGVGLNGEMPPWAEWPTIERAGPTMMGFDTLSGGGIRMHGEVITSVELLDELEGDDLVKNFKAKCTIAKKFAGYRNLAEPLLQAQLILKWCGK